MHAQSGRGEDRIRPSGARGSLIVTVMIAAFGVGAAAGAGEASADNSRFNNGVVADVYHLHYVAGCTGDVHVNPQLRLAAQWHAEDVLTNRSLDGDIGSDGSTVEDRARATGFTGRVAETVAINPALAMSGIELINRWYYDPAALAIMKDCGLTEIGVWSENSLDRTVVVAVYGAAG